MEFRTGVLCIVSTLAAFPAFAQSAPPTPQRPLSLAAIGGLSAGQGDAGGSIGATFAFDVSDRIGIEARGLHEGRGSGETGTEFTATALVTIVRTQRAAPYLAIGGGVYRASFDMGNSRFFGMMNGQYAVGTPFVPIQGMPGFAMMGAYYPSGGYGYQGMMWQGPWTGTTYTTSQMPMFYANRLGQMMVPANGQWGMRSFTDPALTIGGGLKIDVTNRLFVTPDVRGLVVFSSGDHMTLLTMNIGVGMRF